MALGQSASPGTSHVLFETDRPDTGTAKRLSLLVRYGVSRFRSGPGLCRDRGKTARNTVWDLSTFSLNRVFEP